MKYLLLLLVSISLCSCAVSKQDAAGLFQAGLDQRETNVQAATKAFSDSGRAYASLLQNGQGDLGKLAFNASQAFQFGGELHQARTFGLLAVLARPADSKVVSWYQKLRQDVAADPQTEVMAGWSSLFWGREFWTLGGCLILAALLAATLLGYSWRRRGKGWRVMAWFTGIAFGLVFCWSFTGKLSDRLQPIVILEQETALHQGDSLGFPPIDPALKAGTPARVLEMRSGWAHIHAATGVEGWLPAQSIQGLAELLP